MTENVTKILKMYEGQLVLSILESENNYIVSVCDKNANIDSVLESIYAIDKKTFKPSEFSYFDNPDEYAEACNNVLYKHEELTHWGIRGMKWGIRRYQNKDGSLTPAGKKKLREEQAKVRQEEKTIKNRKAVQDRMDRLEARRKAVAENKKELDAKTPKGKKAAEKAAKKAEKEELENQPKKGKKSIKDMTDEELASAINRARMEDTYNQLRPENEGKHQTMKRIKDDVIMPAATNAGRRFLEKAMDKATEKVLGDKVDPDSIEALTKTYQKLDLKQKIDKINSPNKYLSEEDKTKAQDREFKAKDRAAKLKGYDDEAAEAAAKRESDAKNAKAQADEAARKANESKSQEYYDSQYRSARRTTETVGTGRSKTSEVLALPSAKVTDISTSVKRNGQSTTTKLLEGSTSKSERQPEPMVFDKDGTPIAWWSDIRGDSDVII